MLVNGARDQLLARPRFADDEHGRARRRDARDLLVEFDHRGRAPDERRALVAGRGRFGGGCARAFDFGRAHALERAPDGGDDLLDLERLRDEVPGALARSLDRRFERAEAGD